MLFTSEPLPQPLRSYYSNTNPPTVQRQPTRTVSGPRNRARRFNSGPSNPGQQGQNPVTNQGPQQGWGNRRPGQQGLNPVTNQGPRQGWDNRRPGQQRNQNQVRASGNRRRNQRRRRPLTLYEWVRANQMLNPEFDIVEFMGL